MRHGKYRKKLGRTSSHRDAMLRNMATSLFLHERIRTTIQKAKLLKPFAEKLITRAKDDTLHNRRLVLREIHDIEVVRKMFDDFAARYAERPGGYTRIIRLGYRQGDAADMCLIELVDRRAPEAPVEEPKDTKDKKAVAK